MKKSYKLRTGVCVLAALIGITAAGCAAGEGGANESSVNPAPDNSMVPQVSAEETANDLTVRVGTLKGPAGMTMAYMMDKSDAGETQNRYEFSIEGSPDELVPKVISGQLDIAALPTNAAALLYAKTEKKVKIISVDTLGVLYVLTKDDSVASIADLKGKTIYATGQGGVPQYVLEYLLRENDIDPEKDITIEYKSEHSELASLIMAGQADIALLPQPFVTTVTMKDEGVKVAVNVTEEWEKASGGSELPMGCVIARSEFLEQNEAAAKIFMDELLQSTQYVHTNTEESAGLIEKYGIAPKDVAIKAIPDCNLVFIEGSGMQAAVHGFLGVLFDADPKSIGGSMPDEAFYYRR